MLLRKWSGCLDEGREKWCWPDIMGHRNMSPNRVYGGPPARADILKRRDVYLHFLGLIKSNEDQVTF